MNQLGLNFNTGLIRQLKDIASCNRIDDVPIDENELASMADLIKETHKAPHKPINVANSLNDALPIT